MFVDHLRIYAKAGDGGNGCVSFRRAKYIPKGGPDGGDGGRGGSVILQVDSHVDTLKGFLFKPNLKASPGDHGSGQLKTGRSGKDAVFTVPPGTLVYRANSASFQQQPPPENVAEGMAFFYDLEAQAEDTVGASEGEDVPGELIADLTRPGDTFVLCQGGKGGKGNTRFKSATNRAPEQFTPGEPGEEGYFYLEMRKIADAGLVGFPNAGKSTLLSKISAARPKVAAYPFTTLNPMVGVVDFSGFRRATVADIPGLVEGASENVGLGHEFLRHIWRCQWLLFVVDTAGSEGRDPVTDLETLRRELKLYDAELARRKWLIVANKMDLPTSAENLPRIRKRFPKIKVVPVSALQEAGLDPLRDLLEKLVGRSPE
jgi:GTPase